MIEARGVAKSFGAIRVLKGVSFEVPRGSTLIVTGPNGAGKSTLLKIVAGILRPTRGEVVVDGRPPRESRGSIGYLGHEPHLYPYLTAEENLKFFARLYGASPATAMSLLEAVSLTSKAATPAGVLSFGESRRLGIARALLHDPEVLIVDEPLAGLDEEASASVPRLLTRDNRSLLVATHDVESVAALGGERLSISSGVIS
jgi:heme ABC exporter ATP-binding subunit CcmA